MTAQRVAEIEAASAPETVCRRCGGPNVWSWHAPSPVWNAVMRADDNLEDRWEVVCPTCFAELAEGKDIGGMWRFAPYQWQAQVSFVGDADRRWDPPRCLWVPS